MSEVKYQAVPVSCLNCENYNKTENKCEIVDEVVISPEVKLCCDWFKSSLNKDTSKVTLEQAREKFESHIAEELKKKRHDDSNRYYDFNTEQQWMMYWQALEDHDILEEGE